MAIGGNGALLRRAMNMQSTVSKPVLTMVYELQFVALDS